MMPAIKMSELYIVQCDLYFSYNNGRLRCVLALCYTIWIVMYEENLFQIGVSQTNLQILWDAWNKGTFVIETLGL